MAAINAFLEALEEKMGGNYHLEEAPDTAAYPFRVGSLTGSFDDEVAEVFTLELDYWDENKSSERIYDMAEADAGDGDREAPTGLNAGRIDFPGGHAVLFKENTTPIQDPDKNLRRIRISYTVRFYYEEE